MTMDQRGGEVLERWWRRLIRVVMVVSCLELPNKSLGRRDVVGVSCFKDETGSKSKCG